jgi:alanine-synthesizing transaminase
LAACGVHRPVTIQRRFGVKLDPETQIVATLGSKEGFANMAQAIAAPGDVVLCPNPSYPIHAFGFLMAGAAIRHIPVATDSLFFDALERAVQHSIPKPLAVVLCYPSNPTATVADLDFYRDVVAFCRKHDVLILSDLAYSEIYFDGDPPPSLLQIDGCHGYRGGVHLDVQELLDAGVADGICGRQ